MFHNYCSFRSKLYFSFFSVLDYGIGSDVFYESLFVFINPLCDRSGWFSTKLLTSCTLDRVNFSFRCGIFIFYFFVYDIYHHHHHHHIVLVARISLTLSRHSSLSFIALGRSSGQHPVSSHSCWMYVRAGRPAFARPCVGIHKSTSLMSSSLLLI